MVAKLLLLATCLATTAIASHCSSCNLTLKGELRSAEIVSRLTATFGFDPNVKRVIPENVMKKAKTIAQHTGLRDEEEEKTTTKQAIHLLAHEDENDDNNAISFHFHNETKGRGVVRADLSLFISKPDIEDDDGSERKQVTINVYHNDGNGQKGELLASHRVLTPVHNAAHHRVRLNAHAIERIATKDVGSLIVEAMLYGENLVVLPGDDDADDHPMSLSVVVAESKRTKRWAPNFCKKGEKDQACCLFSNVVDFMKMGWDFIAMPRRFEALACGGHCRERTMHHSFSGSISRDSALESAGVAATCCHPDAFEPLQVVYVTPSDNVVTVWIDDMVAIRCGCA